MLCDLLAGTNVAGRPASYFRTESIARWHLRLNVPVAEHASAAGFDRRYIDAVLREGRGDSSIFGFRLMQENLDHLTMHLDHLFPGLGDDRACLEAAFGPLLYIHLSRTDKVVQAVSLVKALQTGLWHLAPDGTERERTSPAKDTAYDRNRIGKYIRDLTAQDQAWSRWFAENRIVPLALTYEALSREPRGALESVLSALSLDPAIAAAVRPKTRKMSDFESQDWVSRFRAETEAGSA
jgi:trehalose 2-sulfotransferase